MNSRHWGNRHRATLVILWVIALLVAVSAIASLIGHLIAGSPKPYVRQSHTMSVAYTEVTFFQQHGRR